MPFPHKTVLVTGATAGIGRALSERMIENGVFVIAVGRRRERLEELVRKHGPEKVAAEAFDVADLGAIPGWADKYVVFSFFLSSSCTVPRGSSDHFLLSRAGHMAPMHTCRRTKLSRK